jgi:hypothetical protein
MHDAAIAVWYITTSDAPRVSFQTKSGGSSAGVLASLTPISRNFTPCAATGEMMPRVWPGTSVILAPVVVRPKRASSDCERAMPAEIMEASIISVCQLKGRACHAMSPWAMACSMRRRSWGEACSRYS